MLSRRLPRNYPLLDRNRRRGWRGEILTQHQSIQWYVNISGVILVPVAIEGRPDCDSSRSCSAPVVELFVAAVNGLSHLVDWRL